MGKSLAAWVLVVVAVCGAGCASGGSETEDSGAGARDGSSALDAGDDDAGAADDAGATDDGGATDDAGATDDGGATDDAGPVDAGVDAPTCADVDGDGYGSGACLGADCDDGDPDAHPGATELCNGVDDDCDGTADDGFAMLGTACTAGTGACSASGTIACSADGTATECSAVPGTGSPETCDGADNDCDGTIDGALPRACYTGPAGTLNVGACAGGMQTCSGAAYGACVGETTPGTETCNAVDDDCDGAVDDAIVQSCYGGPAGTAGVGVCRTGMQACSVGSFGPCSGEVRPAAEICANGIDEDCDGAADDGCVANDLFANATTVALAAAEVTIAGSTVGATRDGATVPCGCTSAGNVWYRFTLASTAVVYADTAGSSFDTSLWITDASGTPIPGQSGNGRPDAGVCNDDAGCTGLGGFASTDSRTWAYLTAGTYYVSVSGCSTGAFTLHLQQIPTSSASYFYAGRLSGMGTTSTVLVGTSAQTSTCGGTASGEDARWFVTCGGQQQFFSLCSGDGGTFTRSNGTTSFDPSLYIRSAQSGAEVTCNDDGPSAAMCVGTGGDSANYGSRLNNVIVPRGLHVLYVDERVGGSGMNYTLAYTVR